MTQQHLCHRVLLCESFGLHHVASSMLTPPSPAGTHWHPHQGRRTQAASLSSPFMTWTAMRARSFGIEKVKLYKWSHFFEVPHTSFNELMNFSIETCSSNHILPHCFKQLLLLFNLEPETKNMGNWHLASVNLDLPLEFCFRTLVVMHQTTRLQRCLRYTIC